MPNEAKKTSTRGQNRKYGRNNWLIVVPVILFVILAVCVRARLTVGLEGWAYSKTAEHMSPAMTSVVKGITHIGDTAVVILICLTLIVIPKTRGTIALPVSGAVILSFVLNIALKHVLARERPDILRLINETSYSFPSGHAMINSSLYIILLLFIFKYIKNRWTKWILASVCAILIIAIGFSRVYLGVHYAGDILGGWMFGFAVSIFVYNVWKRRAFKSGR
ncbi:MAG: undecaprenyl pyrophosphate phosphatase [Firmicutes bacterium ADurb.Bin182]|nr:MAG: undecaprenyl pyrophosphate phosphatase [Firmicutes bacterium ADurb.Bin182]